MRAAEKADCWNCTPQLVLSHLPKMQGSSAAEKDVWSLARNPWADGTNDMEGSGAPDMFQRRYIDLMEATRVHDIDMSDKNVYTLGSFSELNMLQTLRTNLDPETARRNYQESICHMLGVPVDLVLSGAKSGVKNINQSGMAYTVNSRLFANTMRDLSKQIAYVLEDIYLEIYKETATFKVTPVPRLEVQSYEDIERVIKSGLLTESAANALQDQIGEDFISSHPHK
eukprot:192657-Rhodomonas_salina.1